MSQDKQVVRYYPEVFDAKSLDAAKNIILTNEGEGADTETRWALETPYITALTREHLQPTHASVVIDYGCGIGRISKELIEQTDCLVVGVDISPEMRAMALEYVSSDRFIAVSPTQLDSLVSAGLRADSAIAIWVLQHCFSPSDEVERMKRALRGGGKLLVLNMYVRAVPAVIEAVAEDQPKFLWANDAVDVAALLRAEFSVVGLGEPDQRQVPNMADAGAYWMCLRATP
jgi:SAM-dependent methyltransferase